MRATRAPLEHAPASRAPQRSGKSAGGRLELKPSNADPLRDPSPARSRSNRSSVDNALNSSGQPLHEISGLRPDITSRFGFDFSQVRIHSGPEAAESASRLQAQAYTAGSHIVFGQGEFNPHSSEGRTLLTHELAHVAQQGVPDSARSTDTRGLDHSLDHGIDGGSEAKTEAQAKAAATPASTYSPGHDSNMQSVEPGTLQRSVSMRDVGRGDQSGFDRVPDLVARLNAVSKGLTFSLDGSNNLTYTPKKGATLSNFDTQMQGFIDQEAVVPLRFTNRHGLLGTPATGYHGGVMEDAWASGYVDIDDLLASNNLGMQTVLVHFLRERSATFNYAHRMGSESLELDPAVSANAPAHLAELNRAHEKGIDSEAAVLRDFFNDPSIRLIDHDAPGDNVLRRFRNSRKDAIHTRLRPGAGKDTGIDAIIVEVYTRDGKVHTPEEYRDMLTSEAAALGTHSSIPPNTNWGWHFSHGATVPP